MDFYSDCGLIDGTWVRAVALACCSNLRAITDTPAK